MGNNTSKKPSVIPKTPEKSVDTTSDQSPTTDDTNKLSLILVPKTPAIPQTPLTQTIASHLNRITNEDRHQNQTIKTPSYLLRKKILYDLGYTYSIKDTDPRSPSISIPRTPLKLAENVIDAVSESESSSFQYNTTLEESCRDFNAKLDDITMEGSEAAELDENEANEDAKEDCIVPQKKWHGEMTLDDDSKASSDLDCVKNNSDDNAISVVDGNSLNSSPVASEENISPSDGMYSTPLPDKLNRPGRIPLSVINRRGISAEMTPLNPKNIHESYSVENCKNNLSLNKFDENRASARKSKIPVFKK